MWPISLNDLAEAVGVHPLPLPLGERLVQGLSTDSRSVGAHMLFVPLRGEKFDGHDFVEGVLAQPARVALVHSHWQHTSGWQAAPDSVLLRVDDVLAAFRRLAKQFRARLEKTPCVAIGGSNGKTTTKEMLLSLSKGEGRELVVTQKSENGYIGIPKTLCGPGSREDLQAFIVEVGIDEVGAMESHLELVQPSVRLLTSIAEEHLEGLIDLETVAREELRLMEGDGVRVWQGEDSLISDAAREGVQPGDWFVASQATWSKLEDADRLDSAHRVLFRVRDPLSICPLFDGEVFLSGECDPSFQFSVQMPQPGDHNVANFALAFAGSCELERQILSKDVSALTPSFFTIIKDRFSSYRVPENRSNLVTFSNGSLLLSDCYNANPASVIAVLDWLSSAALEGKNKWIFLGDMLDLGDDSKSKHLDLINHLSSSASGDRSHRQSAEEWVPEFRLYLFGNAQYDVYLELMRNGAKGFLVEHLFPERDPTVWLKGLSAPTGQTVAVLKGSRGMQMERLLDGLSRLLSS